MRGLLAEYGCAQTRSHTHALLHTRIVAPSHTLARSRTHRCTHTHIRSHTCTCSHTTSPTCATSHARTHTHTPCVVSTDSNHLRPERREAHGRRAGCQLGGSPGLWPPVLGRNANHAETGSANVPFPLKESEDRRFVAARLGGARTVTCPVRQSREAQWAGAAGRAATTGCARGQAAGAPAPPPGRHEQPTLGGHEAQAGALRPHTGPCAEAT